ncbi:MAG: L-threonylcarbamoyladenylate synthase [Armatimonadota bacterium]
MKHIKIDINNINMNAIYEAAEYIKKGELVIFPTETVYGLAADALNIDAVKKIYIAKQRSDKHSLPVQIDSIEKLSDVAVNISESAIKIGKKYWPGPLTMILEKNDKISDFVSGGKKTIGVRIPDHPVALAFIKACGVPIIATSANVSGMGYTISADDAIKGLEEYVSILIDSGQSEDGLPSTIIDVTTPEINLLRQGSININDIIKTIQEV